MVIAFALAVVAFGRWKGLRSLVSLGITFGVVLLFIVPAILDGRSPMLVAIVGSAAIMLVSLYLSHGWNRTTTVAVLGTLASLVLTGALAQGAVHLAYLNGVLDEETTTLAMQYPIDMSGLLLAGILIGALGVIDDVTVSQAATVDEVAKANPRWGRARLFSSGMRVGRDHLTSVINTLVLAYAGASLPLLVLISAANRPLGQILTSQTIATEITRSVVGTLGLIAAVPITTWLAAALARREPPKEKQPKERKRPKPDPEPSDNWGEDDSPYPPSHLRLSELLGRGHELPRGLVQRMEHRHDRRTAGRGGAVHGVDVATRQRLGDTAHRHVAALGRGHPRRDGHSEALRHQRQDRVQALELRDRRRDALGAPQPVQGHPRRLAFGRGDPGLVGERMRRELPFGRQRVPGRQDRDERVGDEVMVGERADRRRAADPRPVVDEGQVDLT
nr:YibE/F family protein [Glycomyces sp. L485]